jgi:hypothetical protein
LNERADVYCSRRSIDARAPHFIHPRQPMQQPCQRCRSFRMAAHGMRVRLFKPFMDWGKLFLQDSPTGRVMRELAVSLYVSTLSCPNAVRPSLTMHQSNAQPSGSVKTT